MNFKFTIKRHKGKNTYPKLLGHLIPIPTQVQFISKIADLFLEFWAILAEIREVICNEAREHFTVHKRL